MMITAILFLFFSFRHLESCYPKFPSEKDFVNVIQGESGASDGEGSTDVAMLQRFVLEKERLQVSNILIQCCTIATRNFIFSIRSVA